MSKTWYPMVDMATCTGCGECVRFCGHAVYDKARETTPTVIRPDDCVDHCHNCGNLCPAGSITYFGEDTDWTPPHAVGPQACCSSTDGDGCGGAEPCGCSVG